VVITEAQSLAITSNTTKNGVQDAAITVNTDKVVITEAQSLAITSNTTKNASQDGQITANATNIVNNLHKTGGTMTGDITFKSSQAFVGGALGVTGNSTLGNTDVGGTLGVTGNSTLVNTAVDGTLEVTGDSTLGNTAVDGTLGVTGNSTLVNTTVGGTLEVTGNITLKHDGSVKFEVEANTGNTAIVGTLEVTGDTTLNGTLDVTDINVAGDIIMSEDKLIDGVDVSEFGIRLDTYEDDHAKILKTTESTDAGKVLTATSDLDVYEWQTNNTAQAGSYDAGKTYLLDELAFNSKGVLMRSRSATNTGNTMPDLDNGTITNTFWDVVDKSVAYWNVATSYTKGDTVIYGGKVLVAQVDSPSGNPDGADWGKNLFIKDTSSSKYMDIGEMRIMWGSFYCTQGGGEILIFPNGGFGSVPSLTVTTSQFGSYNMITGYYSLSKNAVSITIMKANGQWATGGITSSWMAIGLKP
ncbi:MAG: hypothetical protein HRT66_13405, partial [Flavobacteriaceae bacterium]|nr:hypothetical protein [Flavobacteriaceae bacterium]